MWSGSRSLASVWTCVPLPWLRWAGGLQRTARRAAWQRHRLGRKQKGLALRLVTTSLWSLWVVQLGGEQLGGHVHRIGSAAPAMGSAVLLAAARVTPVAGTPPPNQPGGLVSLTFGHPPPLQQLLCVCTMACWGCAVTGAPPAYQRKHQPCPPATTSRDRTHPTMVLGLPSLI